MIRAESDVQAAMAAESWALRRYPFLQRGEVLGLAWEAASRVPAEFARRKASLAVWDFVKLSTRSRATVSAVRFSGLTGDESYKEARREPDRFARLADLLAFARLTPKQADALRGWMHGASLTSESVRLGVSKDRVSQLRYRALERLGGAP